MGEELVIRTVTNKKLMKKLEEIAKDGSGITNSQSIFYWLQYLMHFENLSFVFSIGAISLIVGLIALSLQYSDRGHIFGFLASQIMIGFIAILVLWLRMSKKNRTHKARFLIDCILKGEITDNKEISREWFKKRKKPNKILLGLGIGIIIAGIYFIIEGKYFDISLLYIFIGIVIILWTGVPSIINKIQK